MFAGQQSFLAPHVLQDNPEIFLVADPLYINQDEASDHHTRFLNRGGGGSGRGTGLSSRSWGWFREFLVSPIFRAVTFDDPGNGLDGLGACIHYPSIQVPKVTGSPRVRAPCISQT